MTSTGAAEIGVALAQNGARALIDGKVAEASASLRRAATLLPSGIDILSNLAACAQRLGREDAASFWLQRLLSVAVQDYEALVALALVHPLGRLRSRAARRGLALSPGTTEGWMRLGAVEMDTSPAVSIGTFRRVLALEPMSAPALIGCGLSLGRLGRRGLSLDALRGGLALTPDRVDGWDALADPALIDLDDGERLRVAARAVMLDPWRAAGWHRLGNGHWAGGRAAQAGLCYRRALSLVPQLVEAMANLGAALRELGLMDETRRCFDRAVALAPDSAGAMTNLGTALTPGAGIAFRWHRRALLHEPAHAHALNNLGSQHLARNEATQALRWFDRAINAGYPDGEARWNRGVARLLEGDLIGGLADYEGRWRLRAFWDWRRGFEEPEWMGEPANGRTILAHAEQGLGDTIQFVRYLAPLADMGFKVVLECQPPLVRLMRRIRGADMVVGKGDTPPRFDVHVPLMSLPARFRTALDTIPADVPYLGSSTASRPVAGTRRIGLVWAGNPQHKNDKNRSIDVAALDRLATGLAALPDVSTVSLQLGPRAGDLDRAISVGAPIEKIAPPADFAETAETLAALDLVIGVDTAVMHLVGALARPGWLLLPFAPDWRWLLDRSDTPWYPTLRLYRQPAPGDWNAVIDRVLSDLRPSAGR